MQFNGVDLDPTANPAITESVERLNSQTGAGRAAGYNAGQTEARGLLTSGADNLNSSLSYGDRATSDAIRQRYMPHYNRMESEMKLENLKNAQGDHLRALKVASAAAGQEVEMNKQKAILKDKIEQANKRARGQMIGNVLGIVGGVAGGVLGAAAGGVGAGAGAMAGYQLGQGAGNAIGGS